LNSDQRRGVAWPKRLIGPSGPIGRREPLAQLAQRTAGTSTCRPNCAVCDAA
jgi:hypothetical protein